jgi:hypothetical protein
MGRATSAERLNSAMVSARPRPRRDRQPRTARAR